MSAHDTRVRMGIGAARLMDLADDELDRLIADAERALRRLDRALRDRGARDGQRASMLIGTALALIVGDREQDGPCD